MRLNEHVSRQYIVIEKFVGTSDDIGEFFEKEEWDELKDECGEIATPERYYEEKEEWNTIRKNGKVKDEHPFLSFFDSKEEFDELNDDTNQIIIFEGYVDIPDVEICEHPDFESFIKEDALK